MSQGPLFVINPASSGSSGADYPPGYINGARLTYNSGTSITVGTGNMRDQADAENIDVSSSLTITTTGSGALGLDTGSRASQTRYNVWVLYNPSTTAVTALISLSATLAGVTKPSGFTSGRRVGAVSLDSSLAVRQFLQTGDGYERWYEWLLGSGSVADANFTVLSVSGTGQPTTFTTISVDERFFFATSSYMRVEAMCTNDNQQMFLRPGGTTPPRLSVGVGSTNDQTFNGHLMPCNVGSPAGMQWRVTDTTTTTAFVDVFGCNDVLTPAAS